MTERLLSARELNRALLARQLLLGRSDFSIPAALETMCGIQNQYAPNAYIRLWSCLRRFRRDDLTAAYERGTVVQATLMRGTIHTVSASDYRPFVAAIRESRRSWARRVHRDDGEDREDLVERLRAALKGRTLPRRELDALRPGAGTASWATLDTDAELIRVPPSGTWERRRADRYALAEDRIGKTRSGPRDPLAHLVRRYLRAFGPAHSTDIASFTGVSAGTLGPVLERLTLRRFRDERGAILLDVPNAPLPDAETAAPVRFLPTWDAALLVHARRSGVLPERYRPVIFSTKMPASYPTFLVDGIVAGTWRHDAGRVTTAPFESLAKASAREVEEEAELLAAFHRE